MAIQKRNDELINLLEADFLRSKMPLVAHNGIGGFWDNALTIASGTTITVFSGTSPYRVTELLGYSVVTAGDSRAANTGAVILNDSAELFNDGDTILVLRVTAAGGVELQRTAGAQTLKVKLRLDWI